MTNIPMETEAIFCPACADNVILSFDFDEVVVSKYDMMKDPVHVSSYVVSKSWYR